MIIDVVRLSGSGEVFKGEESTSILDMDGDGSVCLHRPIEYELRAYLAGRDLIVQGSVALELSFKCSKCAEFFELRVADEDFTHVKELSDDIESVDLTEDIREAMLLLFPTYPVCRRECKGLCAQCGADLNKAECQCEKPADVRWGDLDKLNIQ